MKNIAVLGCTFKSNPSDAIVVPTSTPSTKCIAGGKNVYLSPMSVSISYIDKSGFAGSATAVINSTAQKCKVNGQMVMLEGDSVDIVMTLTGSVSPYTKIINMHVEIDSAGQTSARGN